MKQLLFLLLSGISGIRLWSQTPGSLEIVSLSSDYDIRVLSAMPGNSLLFPDSSVLLAGTGGKTPINEFVMLLRVGPNGQLVQKRKFSAPEGQYFKPGISVRLISDHHILAVAPFQDSGAYIANLDTSLDVQWGKEVRGLGARSVIYDAILLDNGFSIVLGSEALGPPLSPGMVPVLTY